jgi:hypothetical protein
MSILHSSSKFHHAICVDALRSGRLSGQGIFTTEFFFIIFVRHPLHIFLEHVLALTHMLSRLKKHFIALSSRLHTPAESR